MTSSLVSIIIPVYKVEKYISRCLDSILNQTFQNFEVILINDCSLDNSRTIAQSYAQNNERIRIIDNNENSGAAWSRMVGYSNARGKYITFCDPDDFLPKNALEVLYNAISQDSEADICIGDYQRVYPDGSKSNIFENHLNYGHDKWSAAKSTLKYETPHFLWNKIYKAELFKDQKIITYKRFSNSSDEFLFFQVLQNCEKVINISDVVYYYYDNQESASHNKSNVSAINGMITSLKYIENQYKDNKDFSSILHKWKLGKYSKFLVASYPNKKLLKIIFENNIDYLFTPWNLLKHTYKTRAFRLFILYIKAKVRSFV